MLTTTVCAALSAAGLAIAFLTAYRRRFLAATRIAAVSLLPGGLAMAGLIELGGDVAEAVGTWAAHLVFDPGVWVGFGVLAVSAVLFVIARFARSRTAARNGTRKERRAAARAERRRAASARGSSPAIAPGPGRASGGARSGAAASGAGASEGGEDFSEIEAILRKHGI